MAAQPELKLVPSDDRGPTEPPPARPPKGRWGVTMRIVVTVLRFIWTIAVLLANGLWLLVAALWLGGRIGRNALEGLRRTRPGLARARRGTSLVRTSRPRAICAATP